MRPALLALVFVAACNGGDAMSPMANGTARVQASLTSSMTSGGNIQLMGSPSPGKPLGVKEIIVTIDKVTAHSSSAGWVKLSSNETQIDVLKLSQYAADLGFANVPAGKITQLRLYVKEGATQYVTRDDGQRIDLKVPSGIQSGIKLKGMFDAAQCTTSTVPLTWNGKKSIWVHPTGQGDEWILRPVIHTGSVDGTMVGCTGTPTTPGGGGDGTIVPPGGSDTPSPGGTGSGGPGIDEGPGGGGTGTTVPGVGGTGTMCASPSACLSGDCASGYCAPGGADAPCNVGSDCVSGACSAGACGPGGAVGSGGACTTNSGCLSGACIGGVCGSGGQGQPCKIDGDCLSGYSCLANACQAPIN